MKSNTVIKQFIVDSKSSSKTLLYGILLFGAALCFMLSRVFHLSSGLVAILFLLFTVVDITCYLWILFRKKKIECNILKDQLDKSALLLSKQQEHTRKINEQVTSLNSRILLSKQQLESTFDAIYDGICVLDKKLTIQRVNQAYSRLVNTPIRDLLGRKCYNVFLHSKRPCNNCPTLDTINSGEIKIRKTITRIEKDHTYHYEISSYPVKDESGKLAHVIESIHDVTEQRQMNEQLIRSEKLATIGIMTAGIAHEINNPLSGISGNVANMLQKPEKYGLNEKGIDRLGSMLEASERATRIMRNLLDLSRHTEGELIFADINEITTNALGRIHLPGYSQIIKEIHACKELLPVRCDPVKIEQVIINLLTNASYAIEEKKQYYKKHNSERKDTYQGLIYIQTQRQENKALVIVEDNGIGVSEDKMKHIFDPFYTTRPPGQGTGLGLSVSHKIVAEHGGKIWAEQGKKGAQFFLELPFDRVTSI